MQLLALLYLVAVTCGAWGYAVGRHHVFPHDYLAPLLAEIQALFTREAPLKYHVQETRNRFGYTGFQRRDAEFVDPGYLLLARFSAEHEQVVIELVRISDFQTMHAWVPPVEDILQKSVNYQSIDTKAEYRAQHPLLLPDGAIVFGSGEGALVKIDKLGKVVWIINEYFHHSIELSHNDEIVAAYVNSSSALGLPLRPDGYAVLSQDGEVVARYAVDTILAENGYLGLMLGVGQFENDRFHLNDAQPILEEKGLAQVGDVAVSMRNLSTVFLYRPITNKIIWLKTGPWLNQHDIDMLPNGGYSIFGNDIIRFGNRFNPMRDISNVYVFNAETGAVTAPYTKVFKKVKMFTATSGRSRILSNGDVYIEESDASRVLRVSREEVRWEFVNGIDGNKTGALHWSRYLTEEEVEHFWEN